MARRGGEIIEFNDILGEGLIRSDSGKDYLFREGALSQSFTGSDIIGERVAFFPHGRTAYDIVLPRELDATDEEQEGVPAHRRHDASCRVDSLWDEDLAADLVSNYVEE